MGTTSVGSKSFGVNATDAVGNQATVVYQYQVGYSLGACLGEPGHAVQQPINVTMPFSTFKKGSTVPTKFRVCDANGVSIGSPGLVTGYGLIGTSSGTSYSVDETVYSTAADNAFRWDPSAQQWIFNQSTKNNPSLAALGVMYYFVNLDDGSQIFFNYQLK